MSTGERENSHIIGHRPGSFASSSFAPLKSYHPGASEVSAGALPYSETRWTWKVHRNVTLQEGSQPLRSDYTEISSPVRPLWARMRP